MKNDFILDRHWGDLHGKMTKTHEVGVFNPNIDSLQEMHWQGISDFHKEIFEIMVAA